MMNAIFNKMSNIKNVDKNVHVRMNKKESHRSCSDLLFCPVLRVA